MDGQAFSGQRKSVLITFEKVKPFLMTIDGSEHSARSRADWSTVQDLLAELDEIYFEGCKEKSTSYRTKGTNDRFAVRSDAERKPKFEHGADARDIRNRPAWEIGDSSMTLTERSLASGRSLLLFDQITN